MSFVHTDQTSQALETLGSTSGYAWANAPNLFSSGTNYEQTLLNGNQANTTAMLQPDINRIKSAEQNTLQGISTLTPRGGGRDSSLFAQPFAANTQVQNLFNPARAGAATNLESAGSNLFGIGNSAANDEATIAQRQQQMTQQFWSQLGAGLFGAATTPFGGAGSATSGHGLFSLIPGIGSK